MGRPGSRSPPAATAEPEGAGMSGLRRKRRPRVLAVLVALALVLLLGQPSAASAASLRFRVWDFNACDQFGRSNADCQVTPTQRASAITSSVTSFDAHLVTLQEMCHSTFDMVVASLPTGWVGYFFSTFTTTD